VVEHDSVRVYPPLICPCCRWGSCIVVDSATNDEVVVRQRKCRKCEYSWLTTEVDADQAKVMGLGVFKISYINGRRVVQQLH
jgi:transcriptional regulator NrdR family protein